MLLNLTVMGHLESCEIRLYKEAEIVELVMGQEM